MRLLEYIERLNKIKEAEGDILCVSNVNEGLYRLPDSPLAIDNDKFLFRRADAELRKELEKEKRVCFL